MLVRAGLIGAVLLSLAAAPASAGPSVVVDGVTINGAISNLDPGVANYFGIPYASAARWSPPAAHAPLPNPFDAADVSNVAACPQNEPVVIAGVALKQSEDCLSLNVFVPTGPTAESKLPVMVWIHGGAFESGAGAEYQPVEMVARHKIVAVSINYRLGALGWLAQQAIESRKQNPFENLHDSGNYGLMDQQFALAWVKKNIAAFGGDPNRVTIAGESAGGFSVALQLTSTSLANGLFRGGIIESGAYEFHDMPPKGLDELFLGNPFVNAVLSSEGSVRGVNCSSLTATGDAKEVRTCLNGASVHRLLSAASAISYIETPVSGTLIEPDGLNTALSGGNFIKVPVIQGINANEGRYFEPAAIPFAASFDMIVAAGGPANYDLSHDNAFCGGSTCSYTQEINLALASEGFPASLNTKSFDANLAKTYPLSQFPDRYLAGNASSADEALSQIGTDWRFACNAQDANVAMAQFVSVYAYEFNDPKAPPTVATPTVTKLPNDQYGYPTASEHGAELQFLFAFPSTASLRAREQKLADAMQAYWANFVRFGDPNHGGRVASWPVFTGAEEVQELVPDRGEIGPIDNYGTAHFCSLWDSVNGN
ncbi:MAG TPA: carboxylesterase family protein [Rhizomicrobium sp.]